MAKFKLKRGTYATGTIEAGNVQTFKKGAIVESDQNLAAIDPLKFEPYTGQDGGEMQAGDDEWKRPDGMKSAPPAPPRGDEPAPAKSPTGPGVIHEGHGKGKK